MLKIKNKIKIIALVSILVMVCSVVSFSETASAAKVKEKGFKVDQGTKYFYSGQSGPMKMSWKTYLYYPSQKRKVYQTYYVKIGGKYVVSWHDIVTLNHATRTVMKISDYTDSELCPGTTVTYKKTRLNTRMYYWYVYRKDMLRNLA